MAIPCSYGSGTLMLILLAVLGASAGADHHIKMWRGGAAFVTQSTGRSAGPSNAPLSLRCGSSLAASQSASATSYEEKVELLEKSKKLSLAPMMEYTTPHFRHMVRLLTSRTLLYTEMVTANAIVHERKDAIEALRQDNIKAASESKDPSCEYNASYLRRFLGQGSVPPLEGPSVLQLGGSDADDLRGAAKCVMEMTERGYCDYTALNLNCGCPSPKVAGKGCFGAALMEDPTLVRDLTRAMHEGCGGALPVTVKCRIGTDTSLLDENFTLTRYNELNPDVEYGKLCKFIETIASNGVVTDFQIHARIAVLGKSFSPADNRKVPPLKYDMVRQLVEDYPELSFSLNGGVETLSQTQAEFGACPKLAGVMVGRAWAANPWSFAMADKLLYGDEGEGEKLLGYSKPRNRLELLQMFGKHADAEEKEWDPVKMRRFVTKAISPLFAGEANAKQFRIELDEIGGMPKKLASQGKSWKDEPPLSDLILDAANRHLSVETLLRTPEESYEMAVWEEQKKKSKARGLPQPVVAEWQQERKASDDEI